VILLLQLDALPIILPQCQNPDIIIRYKIPSEGISDTCHPVIERELLSLVDISRGKECNTWEARIQVVDVDAVQSHVRITLHPTDTADHSTTTCSRFLQVFYS